MKKKSKLFYAICWTGFIVATVIIVFGYVVPLILKLYFKEKIIADDGWLDFCGSVLSFSSLLVGAYSLYVSAKSQKNFEYMLTQMQNETRKSLNDLAKYSDRMMASLDAVKSKMNTEPIVKNIKETDQSDWGPDDTRVK